MFSYMKRRVAGRARNPVSRHRAAIALVILGAISVGLTAQAAGQNIRPARCKLVATGVEPDASGRASVTTEGGWGSDLVYGWLSVNCRGLTPNTPYFVNGFGPIVTSKKGELHGEGWIYGDLDMWNGYVRYLIQVGNESRQVVLEGDLIIRF